MNTVQLKFILKLIGFKDYRTSISKIKPNSKIISSERDRICRELCDLGYIACTQDVTHFTIAPPGQNVLTLDPKNLPITATELAVLQAANQGTITPGMLKSIPASQRQLAIWSLIDRGFAKASKIKIQQVWLTERGKDYLRDEFQTSGYLPLYSGEMLNNYVYFLRHSLTARITSLLPESLSPKIAEKPNDDDILKTIRELDRELGTKNYLPIFHLRSKLQPPLSRNELDEALYRLQRSDRIQLGALQESSHYSDEQLAAGIQREFGGALFFITVN